MKNKVLHIFMLLALMPCFYLSAQTVPYKDSLVASKIAQLSAFWSKYNTFSVEQKAYAPFSAIPEVYSITAQSKESHADYVQKVNDAKIKQLKNDVGLAATGNYQENFAPGFGADDDLVYNRRFQAGLDWNILADGYLKNRYERQILENENTINALKPQTKISANDYLLISHKIIYAFNEHKIKLLDKRQQIIADKIDLANELYLLKQLPKLDLMQIIQQQVDVSSMYQIYQTYNEQLGQQLADKPKSTAVLPVFDVNFEKIVVPSNSSISDSILNLQYENIDLNNKAITDINLKTQVRYNYYDLVSQSNPNRSFLSAGLSFSIPLPLGMKASKNVAETQKQLLKFDQHNNATQKELEVLNSIYEFKYKLKQYNNFAEKRKKYEELIRIERVKQKFEDMEFNPVTALSLIDELLSVDIEMLDLQQEMYLQLLDITTKNPGLDVLSIIKPYEAKTTMIPTVTKNKSIYIWSDAITKYGVSYIEEYLRLNKINNAIVSIRKDEKDKATYNTLFEKLKTNSIGVELLIGSNKLLSSKNPEAYFDSILSGINLSGITTIHLDVEPHVLDDWATNKEKYLKQYIDLIVKSKQYASGKNLKLSVSIPVFYPEETLKLLYANCDLVYLMAYEHNDAAFIVRKVKEEFLISADKTVIALRSKDFKNRTEFEALLTELSQALSTTKFALHDFESFVKFDEESVGGNK